MNADKVILDLCGGTGAWSKPYKNAGYDVRVITLPEYDIERWREYPALVELITNNRVYGILAAPPCTMFSYLRNDNTAKTKRDLRKGMRVVLACLDIIHECLYSSTRIHQSRLKFWALENPRGYLVRFIGKPALEFQPWEYGDAYTKRTCLWGIFKEPKKKAIEPFKPDIRHSTFVVNVRYFAHLKADQIPEGYKEKVGLPFHTIVRSITPKGFAKAFFEANK